MSGHSGGGGIKRKSQTIVVTDIDIDVASSQLKANDSWQSYWNHVWLIGSTTIKEEVGNRKYINSINYKPYSHKICDRLQNILFWKWYQLLYTFDGGYTVNSANV